MAEHCPSVMVPFTKTWQSAYHLMPVVLPAEIDRQEVINRLRDRGIQTTVHYPPVHRLTFYRELCPDCRLPQTEEFCRRELTLPLHPRMTLATVEAVVKSLADDLVERMPMEITA
jgi:dTDP-4-amino-4,6-dideoxygalactose transaminase